MSALMSETVAAEAPVSTLAAESERVLLDGSRLAFVAGRGLVAGCREREGVVYDAAGSEVLRVEVVALPSPGERVETPSGEGVWLGVTAGKVGGHLTAKVLLDEGGVRTLSGPAGTFDVARMMIGPGSAEVTRMAAALYVATINHDLQKAEHVAFLKALTEDAHERADAEGWCGEFDDWMEEHGLERRPRDYRLVVSVQADVTVIMSSMRSTQEAKEAVTLSDVWSALSREDISDWEVTDLEEA